MEMFTSTWKKKAPFLAEVVAFTKLLLGWDLGDEGTHSFTGGRGSHTKAFQPHSAHQPGLTLRVLALSSETERETEDRV